MTDTLTRTHETIRRYVFPACREGRHDECPSWQAGYVDGIERRAGEQCSCEHHKASTKPIESCLDSIMEQSIY